VYKPEIGEVLTRHLGRVAAPEELWERIENPQVLARVPTRHAGVRAVLVFATLFVLAVVIHKYSMTPPVSKGARNTACQLCHAGA
jgi:hypothetical protein